jgi:hypothetical protein
MWYLRDEDRRRAKRGDPESSATLYRPSYWSVDPSFNPYKVRENLDEIVSSVSKRITNHEYRPFNPVRLKVWKSQTKQREVSVFPIVETTIATRLFNSLMLKNQVLMSGNSFAYRNDRTSHDAIKYLSREFQKPMTLYVAEYDFSDFFNSINHDFIRSNIENFGIVWTKTEHNLAWKFLHAELQTEDSYQRYSQNTTVPTKGIHLGNSISLFMANVAALEMDLLIERTGVGYVRYADDTIIWGDSLQRVEEAVGVLKSAAARMGAQINETKSSEIRIFGEDRSNYNLKNISSVDYLGYSLNKSATSLNPKVVSRVKTRISKLIWQNLLKTYIKNDVVAVDRIRPDTDLDFVSLCRQIRRYVYGSMTEQKLESLLLGRSLRIRFPGFMSNFPLVSDRRQLAELDSWMVDEIWKALSLRKRALQMKGLAIPAYPYSLQKRDLLQISNKRNQKGSVIHVQLPSFEKIGTAIFNSSKLFGAAAVSGNSKSGEYAYSLEAWIKD